MASAPRRSFGALLILLLVAVTLGATSGPASAVGYRYWNYFHVQNGSYVLAPTGASEYTPPNGSVEAYRYGTDPTGKGIQPRANLSTYTFAKICAGVKAEAGKKRVGVLLDYGVPADAASGETPPKPRAACAVVPTKADGQKVLSTVAKVRFDQLICGIDGYPLKTCSVTVKSAKAPTTKPVAFTLPAAAQPAGAPKSTPGAGSSESGGSGTLVVVGAAVVALLVGGGVALSRRNKSA
jgi:hypothetical protein